MNKNAVLKLSCPLCGKQFKKKSNLTQHEKAHTGEKSFACPVCSKTFAQKSNMKKHCSTHKTYSETLHTLPLIKENTDTSALTTYICQFCTLEFESYHELKRHLSIAHTNEKVFKCLVDQCSSVFLSIGEYNIHCDQHNLERCGKCSYQGENLDSHTCEENQKQRPWKCSNCDARFQSHESLKRHESLETHEHKCQLCKAVYKAERYLRRHVLEEHSGRKMSCPICEKPFKSSKGLRNHVTLHETDGGHLCAICDRRFTNLYGLKRHFAMHTERQFKCSFRKTFGCEKTFYRKDKWLNHIKTHRGNKSIETSCESSATAEDDSTSSSAVVHVEIYNIESVLN